MKPYYQDSAVTISRCYTQTHLSASETSFKSRGELEAGDEIRGGLSSGTILVRRLKYSMK